MYILGGIHSSNRAGLIALAALFFGHLPATLDASELVAALNQTNAECERFRSREDQARIMTETCAAASPMIRLLCQKNVREAISEAQAVCTSFVGTYQSTDGLPGDDRTALCALARTQTTAAEDNARKALRVREAIARMRRSHEENQTAARAQFEHARLRARPLNQQDVDALVSANRFISTQMQALERLEQATLGHRQIMLREASRLEATVVRLGSIDTAGTGCLPLQPPQVQRPQRPREALRKGRWRHLECSPAIVWKRCRHPLALAIRATMRLQHK
jgi:hypothetical protein